jgi:uncharacterized protein (DUF4415 family)
MAPKQPVGSPEWTDPKDAPELTEEFVPDAEIFDGGTFVHCARGRPKSATAKEQGSVRLDPDLLAKLREAGPGWQTQINSLRREALGLRAAGSAKRVA